MAGVIEFLNGINFDINGMQIIKVLQLIIIIAVVTVVVWEFYKSISRKNLITLNLNKFNKTDHPVGSKLLAILFYFLEFLVIMPILILLWFGALSIILMLMAEDSTVHEVLLVAAGVVGACRILAYFKHEVSKELGKLLPLTALAIYVLTLGKNFSFPSFAARIKEIPLLLNDIFSFVIAILIAEVFLRFLFTLAELWISEEKAINSI